MVNRLLYGVITEVGTDLILLQKFNEKIDSSNNWVEGLRFIIVLKEPPFEKRYGCKT